MCFGINLQEAAVSGCMDGAGSCWTVKDGVTGVLQDSVIYLPDWHPHFCVVSGQHCQLDPHKNLIGRSKRNLVASCHDDMYCGWVRFENLRLRKCQNILMSVFSSNDMVLLTWKSSSQTVLPGTPRMYLFVSSISSRVVNGGSCLSTVRNAIILPLKADTGKWFLWLPFSICVCVAKKGIAWNTRRSLIMWFLRRSVAKRTATHEHNSVSTRKGRFRHEFLWFTMKSLSL